MKLKTFMSLCAVAVFFGCADEKPMAPNAPNIVFILADDASWKHFGVYGSSAVNTPNIDKMAKRRDFCLKMPL